MKKLVLMFTMFFAMTAISPVYSQVNEKSLKKNIKDCEKFAKKEAKRLMKQGFYVPIGESMRMLLENTCIMKQKTDKNKDPLYFVGTANTTGETPEAAHKSAIKLARTNIATSIGSLIAEIASEKVNNNQITKKEAASITKTYNEGKELVVNKLGNTIYAFTAYKDIGEENVECNVIILYNKKEAYRIAKQVLRKELEGKMNEVDNVLDKFFKDSL